MLLTAALITFLLTAAGGLALAALRVKRMALPAPLVLGHGLLAAAGLVMLGVVVYSAPEPGMLSASLALFGFAAMGGFGALSYHLRQRPLPLLLVGLHAAVALAALATLIIGAATGTAP